MKDRRQEILEYVVLVQEVDIYTHVQENNKVHQYSISFKLLYLGKNNGLLSS